MEKLTLVSISCHGRHFSTFTTLPYDKDGKCRLSFRQIWGIIFPHTDYPSGLTIGIY